MIYKERQTKALNDRQGLGQRNNVMRRWILAYLAAGTRVFLLKTRRSFLVLTWATYMKCGVVDIKLIQDKKLNKLSTGQPFSAVFFPFGFAVRMWDVELSNNTSVEEWGRLEQGWDIVRGILFDIQFFCTPMNLVLIRLLPVRMNS
jgi:hypothetical protein